MKTKNTYFKIIAFLLLTINFVNAQVGIGTIIPNGALDISSTTDGLLIPRVALTNTTSALPLTLPTVSELVYNSATVADVTPGYYYWNGSIWVRLAAGVSTDWSVLGNTGIVDGTNFIGTAALTNVDVAFRRNNLPSGKIGLTSTSFGVGALNAGAATNSSAFGTNALTLNTGTNNVAVGNGSLAANTTGGNNVAIGNSSLAINTNGASNVAIGTSALAALNGGVNNTAVGFNALLVNTAGANTAFGYRALAANSTSTFNTAVGYNALATNSIGQWNTALGYNALTGNSTGQNNVAIGFNALARIANPQQCVAIGAGALGNNTGNNNTVIGYNAMSGLNTGIDNIALGISSLAANTSGQQNTAVGGETLVQNSTASFSTAIGFNSMRFFNGSQNTAVGYQAGNGINPGSSIGTNNVFMGYQAGFRNTSGGGNVLIGAFSGDNISSGSSNIFLGLDAGNQNTTGSNNIGIGANAGNANTTTSSNINIGFQAGNNNTGANNVNIGHQAGSANTLGGNVNIGYQAGSAETTANKLYISNSATTATTSLIYGDFSGTRILRTNSTFQIGDPAGTGYVFPIARGTNNQYLASNASGVLSWTSPDPLPNSILSVIRGNLSANQILTAPASNWEKITFDTEAYDTNSELTGGTFTCTKNGFYQINAGYHTDNTGTLTLFGIAVYVNGVLYQENTHDHNGGQVSRSINCTLSLSIGQTVEIYVRNPDAGRQIDSFSGKTYFEVIQIR
jgi:trimeric autotransporter adhesin